jgi:Pregnancy-associated plasma protein-A
MDTAVKTRSSTLRFAASLLGLALAFGAQLAHAAGKADTADTTKRPLRAVTLTPEQVKAQMATLDVDTGPAFSVNGVSFANQAAFLASGNRCGARHVTEEEKADHEAGHKKWAAARLAQGELVGNRPIGSVTVPVWVHVINRGAGIANGDVPQSQVTAQIQILNDAWANSAFRFQLAGTTRTTNAAWYDLSGEAAELAAKTALKRGGPETLNIYVAGLSGGLLGYAYLASDAAGVGVLDGVVVLNTTLPGGTGVPYNEGDTGTHEVGHWFGMYHTFDGACTRTGDLVPDTEPEASPAFGCPIGRNSCQVTRTGDPIRNFMDYTDDSCMNMFTRGQFVRMDAEHLQFRTTAVPSVVARASR